MPESKSPKKGLNAAEEHDFSHWQLPDMTEDRTQNPSNLFGKFSGEHSSEPVTEASQSMAPPTMEQIEDIRAAAELEGFEQGKQDGYQQGLEQGRLEGLEQGHLEGFTQGEQQGLEAAQTQINQLGEQLNQILSQFSQPLSILDGEIEAELLAMTLSLAKAVIGHELKTHPEHILSALRQGVDALPLKEQLVKIRLNKTDAEIVNQCFTTEQLQKNQWQIDIDPTLSNGDCMIDSVRSSVDLRIEQRISQVFSELDAQSNQLAKNVKQQKTTHPQYQTTSVDNLSEHQQTTQDPDSVIDSKSISKESSAQESRDQETSVQETSAQESHGRESSAKETTDKEKINQANSLSDTDHTEQHQAQQVDVTDSIDSVVPEKIEPSTTSIEADQVVNSNTNTDVSDDPVLADKANDTQPPQNDLS